MTYITSTESQKRNGWKDESSDNCRKLAGMVQTWRGVVVTRKARSQTV